MHMGITLLTSENSNAESYMKATSQHTLSNKSAQNMRAYFLWRYTNHNEYEESERCHISN